MTSFDVSRDGWRLKIELIAGSFRYSSDRLIRRNIEREFALILLTIRHFEMIAYDQIGTILIALKA